MKDNIIFCINCGNEITITKACNCDLKYLEEIKE